MILITEEESRLVMIKQVTDAVEAAQTPEQKGEAGAPVRISFQGEITGTTADPHSKLVELLKYDLPRGTLMVREVPRGAPRLRWPLVYLLGAFVWLSVMVTGVKQALAQPS